MTVSGELPSIGELNSTADPKVRTLLSELKSAVTSLEEIQHAFKWYEPKVIATEQTRENTSFGTLGTADEVPGVVVPANSLVVISYSALWRSSVANAGRAALFIGANQAKSTNGSVQEGSSGEGATFKKLISGNGGLETQSNETFVTTGEVAGAGLWVRRLAAGTYNMSIQFKSTSGAVTAKERSLAVEVHGA